VKPPRKNPTPANLKRHSKTLNSTNHSRPIHAHAKTHKFAKINIATQNSKILNSSYKIEPPPLPAIYHQPAIIIIQPFKLPFNFNFQTPHNHDPEQPSLARRQEQQRLRSNDRLQHCGSRECGCRKIVDDLAVHHRALFKGVHSDD